MFYKHLRTSNEVKIPEEEKIVVIEDNPYDKIPETKEFVDLFIQEGTEFVPEEEFYVGVDRKVKAIRYSMKSIKNYKLYKFETSIKNSVFAYNVKDSQIWFQVSKDPQFLNKLKFLPRPLPEPLPKAPKKN
eukprot:GHVP01029736.1.p1 GENE.GHVP01029736.1~~GHVP01029736.1.p1  ORF type:complete len:131 (+),score=23.03 GHVP01029736.1:297-689(+)